METHTSTISLTVAAFLFSVLFSTGDARAKYEALFVFGDSYADTGNHEKGDPTLCGPWRAPYGVTWPGSPTGRYSDGWVFTDFYASSLNVKWPIPYRAINTAITPFRGGGINFAFGGSGVFPTFGPQYPTISAQIKQLQQLISRHVVPNNLVNSSTVLLVVAGNDYSAFLQSHAADEISVFIPKVVAQIVASLEELYDLGFRNLVVTNLGPVGCLPKQTYFNDYTSCNETSNQLSKAHNTLLASSISISQIKNSNAKYIILDFYNGFENAMEGTKLSLKPCCEGINGASCGDININGGEALYTMCSNPKSSLFWDYSHPTNIGWKAISKALLSGSKFPCKSDVLPLSNCTKERL